MAAPSELLIHQVSLQLAHPVLLAERIGCLRVPLQRLLVDRTALLALGDVQLTNVFQHVLSELEHLGSVVPFGGLTMPQPLELAFLVIDVLGHDVHLRC